MAITKVHWCGFVLWTPAEISVQRIAFDEGMWKEMEERLIQFYEDLKIPELLKSGVHQLNIFKRYPCSHCPLLQNCFFYYHSGYDLFEKVFESSESDHIPSFLRDWR